MNLGCVFMIRKNVGPERKKRTLAFQACDDTVFAAAK